MEMKTCQVDALEIEPGATRRRGVRSGVEGGGGGVVPGLCMLRLLDLFRGLLGTRAARLAPAALFVPSVLAPPVPQGGLVPAASERAVRALDARAVHTAGGSLPVRFDRTPDWS